MNEEDLLILYTDVSTKAIGGVLMQVQNGIEKPVIFISKLCGLYPTKNTTSAEYIRALIQWVSIFGVP